MSDAIASLSPTGNADLDHTLGNIVANALATGMGAAVGGTSGATAGADVDRFNNQMHGPKPDDRSGHENAAGNDVTDAHLNILPTAGGAMSKDAQPDTFTVGGGTALPAAGLPSTDWVSATKGFSIPNAEIGLTRDQFEQNLLNSGFTADPKGGPKNVTVYSNGNISYSVRDNATSTGGPSADYLVDGQKVSKIRLK